MERKYCENCENFSYGETCNVCSMDFIEPEWLIQRAAEIMEQMSDEVNLKLI